METVDGFRLIRQKSLKEIQTKQKNNTLDFCEKKLKPLIGEKDADGIYIFAYKRQLLALAWNFASKNYNQKTEWQLSSP